MTGDTMEDETDVANDTQDGILSVFLTGEMVIVADLMRNDVVRMGDVAVGEAVSDFQTGEMMTTTMTANTTTTTTTAMTTTTTKTTRMTTTTTASTTTTTATRTTTTATAITTTAA